MTDLPTSNSSPNAPRRILVLDANQRSALAAVRSLGRVPGAIVYTADRTDAALAGSSRYSRAYHRHPSPLDHYEEFTRWLVEFVHAHSIDFLLPMTEISSRSALAVKEQLGDCILPFADLETVLLLSDKWRLLQLAQQVGVPHPRSEYVANAAQLAPPPADRFPLVVKPCLSRIFHDGRWVDTSVHIARDGEQLQRLLDEKIYLREHAFMLQEFIPGTGAGIFALYEDGAPVVFFAHRRLREKPPSGGVSVLSESAPPDPKLLQLARSLLDAARWHGVAMVEFRIGVDGTPYLMEINTRFWGSLQLAIDAGVDFPRLLLETNTGGAATAPSGYRHGRRLRWLLGDCDNLYLTLKDRRIGLGQKLGSIVRFLMPHPGSTRHEIDRLDDLRPAWFELRQYFKG